MWTLASAQAFCVPNKLYAHLVRRAAIDHALRAACNPRASALLTRTWCDARRR